MTPSAHGCELWNRAAFAARFPLLASTLDLTNANGKGSCFHRSAALLLDIPAGSLCVGTVRAATPEELAAIPNASPVPFLHCWIERGEVLLAPTTLERIGRLAEFDRRGYYALNGVDPASVHRMNRAAVKRLAVRHGWLRASPFGNGCQLAEPLGDSLLRALGVAFAETPCGGIIPAAD